jgi:hypothetical protein
MAQREPIPEPTEDVVRIARQKRDELRRLLSELENRSEPMSEIERQQFANLAMGSFADIPTSSYEFIRRKHRELDAEESQRRNESAPS